MVPELVGKLNSVLAALRAGPGETRARLAELRGILAAAQPNEASSAIRQFLRSKSDAPTGRGFKVGGNHFLEEAPTVRTFLLDYLGQIDPASAAEYSRLILSSMDSPDEWALALRNLARFDNSVAGRALLQEKTRELLGHEPWQQNPSAGFLEAFDTAVYVGGTNLLPPLTDLVRKQDNSALAHAAYLALDRLAINDTASVLAALEANPELMQGREQTRANYFARADIRDPAQRQVLESYLLDTRISPSELETFVSLFPNANYMVSQNLLTPTPTPDHASLVSRDAESLRLVKEWLNEPRFERLRLQLTKAQARLEQFVREAAK